MGADGHSAPSRRRLRVVLAVFAYAVLGAVAQRTLLRAGLGTHVYQQQMLGQDCLLHAWTIAWGQHALATAPCTLVDANIFHPERGTLLYSDHLLGLALLSAPLRLLTDDALLVHNVIVVAAPVLDAIALRALAYDLTGDAFAAFVGGLVYGFAALRISVDTCQIQMAAWWLPLVLLGALRAVRDDRPGWGVVAGGALLAQGMTGIYMTMFVTPFLALAHVVWLRRHPIALAPRGWRALLLSEAVAGIALVPTALAYHAVQVHLGIARSPFLNAILSLQPPLLATHAPIVTLTVLLGVTLLRPHDLPRRLRAERSLLLAIVVGALVLALGPAIPLPARLGTIPGPYRLLVELPGFSALRVPARMVHIALLGASVLAAGGVVVLREVGWRAPIATGGAVLAALAYEGASPSLAVQPVPSPSAEPVYRWLAHRRPLTVVELPVDDFALLATAHQYASTVHWQRMLTGTSGIQPPFYPYALRRLGGFPAPDVIADLSALGITHAVVHLAQLTPSNRATIGLAALGRRTLKQAWTQGGTAVYSLRPSHPRSRPLPGRPLGHAGWRATATVSQDTAGRAIDGDPDTDWNSWGDLDASVQRAWYYPSPVLDRWKSFVAAGPASITIDLGATVPVIAVRLRLGGSEPLLLPDLVLEGSSDGTTWTPLPLAPYPGIRALVDQAADMPMASVLPDPRSLRALRIRTGAFECHLHDVEVRAE